MRIGVISDLHGNLPGLRACWERLSSAGTDLVVCLGDLVGYGPFPSEVVDFVMANRLQCVQGNCDRAAGRGREDTGDRFENVHWQRMAIDSMQWTIDQLDAGQRRFLRKLPTEIRLRMGLREVLCVHGLPGNVTGSLGERDSNEVYGFTLSRNSCQVLALGHTHRMFLRSVTEGLIFNPGSVGGGTLPGESTLTILEVDDHTGAVSVSWERVPFDLEEYSIRYSEEGLPQTFLKCIVLGRDPRGEWHTDDIDRRQLWAGP